MMRKQAREAKSLNMSWMSGQPKVDAIRAEAAAAKGKSKHTTKAREVDKKALQGKSTWVRMTLMCSSIPVRRRAARSPEMRHWTSHRSQKQSSKLSPKIPARKIIVDHLKAQVVKTCLKSLQSQRSLHAQPRSQDQRIHHPVALTVSTNLQMLMMVVNKNEWNSCHLLHTDLDQDLTVQDKQMIDEADQDPETEMVTQNIDISLKVAHTPGIEGAHTSTGDPL